MVNVLFKLRIYTDSKVYGNFQLVQAEGSLAVFMIQVLLLRFSLRPLLKKTEDKHQL